MNHYIDHQTIILKYNNKNLKIIIIIIYNLIIFLKKVLLEYIEITFVQENTNLKISFQKIYVNFYKTFYNILNQYV